MADCTEHCIGDTQTQVAVQLALLVQAATAGPAPAPVADDPAPAPEAPAIPAPAAAPTPTATPATAATPAQRRSRCPCARRAAPRAPPRCGSRASRSASSTGMAGGRSSPCVYATTAAFPRGAPPVPPRLSPAPPCTRTPRRRRGAPRPSRQPATRRRPRVRPSRRPAPARRPGCRSPCSPRSPCSGAPAWSSYDACSDKRGSTFDQSGGVRPCPTRLGGRSVDRGSGAPFVEEVSPKWRSVAAVPVACRTTSQCIAGCGSGHPLLCSWSRRRWRPRALVLAATPAASFTVSAPTPLTPGTSVQRPLLDDANQRLHADHRLDPVQDVWGRRVRYWDERLACLRFAR